MQQISKNIFKLSNETRFGSLNTCGYIIKDDDFNILLHSQSKYSEVESFVKDGDIDYFFVSHNHEIDHHFEQVVDLTKAKIIAHENIMKYLPKQIEVDVSLNGAEKQLSNSIHIIPTKGHTDNSICLHYKSETDKNYLFVGDLLYLNHGFWDVLIMQGDGGSKADLINALIYLKTIDVDFIIPNIAVGELKWVETNPKEWRHLIDRLIAKIS